jgi:hypothetical protein
VTQEQIAAAWKIIHRWESQSTPPEDASAIANGFMHDIAPYLLGELEKMREGLTAMASETLDGNTMAHAILLLGHNSHQAMEALEAQVARGKARRARDSGEVK